MPRGDGCCALTLSRQDDIDAVAALIESDAVGDDPWPAVGRWVAADTSADVTARARLLGLPVAALGETRAAPNADHDAGVAPNRASRRDFSSPTCRHVGGTTVRTTARAGGRDRRKVELPGDRRYPWRVVGGLRLENSESFRMWSIRRTIRLGGSGGRRCRSSNRHGPASLQHRASARPISHSDGAVWLRITGPRRRREPAGWVAFGDDARCPVAWYDGTDSDPAFCVTRSPTRLTGLHAALSRRGSLSGGRRADRTVRWPRGVAATYAAMNRAAETRATALQ